MKDRKVNKFLCVRKVYQMTAITMILVLVISLLIVLVTGNPIDNSCGTVQNMGVEERDEELLVSWDKPSGSACNTNTLFDISIEKNGNVIDEINFHTSLELKIEKESCSNYTITVWSLDIAGNPTSSNYVKHFSGIKGTGEVLNLQLTDNILQWDRPLNSENCNLKYRIDVVSLNSNPTQEIVQEERYEISPIPCSENKLTITAIVCENDREGVSAPPKTYTGPVTRSAPKHISTNPDNTGASVTWLVEEEAENYCVIREIEFEFADNTALSNKLPIKDEGVYNLVDLIPSTRYTYTAKWIFEEGNSLTSDATSFLTVPLTLPMSISILLINDDILRIQWEQEYEVDFVTRQEVVVKSLGSQHFLPKTCLTDEGETYQYEVDPSENFLDFSAVRSNFKYHIKVTTYFEGLGLNTWAETEAIAPMKAPGVLQEITTLHQYESNVQYEITSEVGWKIPCDVNGPVKHFLIKISAAVNIPDVTESCTIDLLTEKVSGAAQETYSFNTKMLVPFFDYTVHLTTVLDHPSLLTSESKEALLPPPMAHTPPS